MKITFVKTTQSTLTGNEKYRRGDQADIRDDYAGQLVENGAAMRGWVNIPPVAEALEMLTELSSVQSMTNVPVEPDDYTKIKGIGKVTAGAFHAAGYMTYRDLAEAQVKEITALDGRFQFLNPKRVERWIQEAKALAEAKREIPGVSFREVEI